MAFERMLSFILRLAELVFAAIVAGLIGEYLHASEGASSWSLARFIYTEVVAGLSILLAIIWLFPFASTFIHWPVDIIISICWFVAFGLLVNRLGNSCGYVFNWGNVNPRGDQCGKWKAAMAFAFLSAICWLVSAIVGFLWTRRERRAVVDSRPAHSRRRWYRSRV